MHLTKRDCLKISKFSKTFANPLRVQLMCSLKIEPKNVSTLCDELLSKESNISQQLRYLWQVGYIAKKKKGRETIYSLKNTEVIKLLHKLKELAK